MTFLGIDIGTTSVCGGVFNSENRKFETVTLKNNAHVSTSHSWEKIQDPDKLMALVSDIISTFSVRYPRFGGIGITGQMHGILYTDDQGNALSPLYTWEDTRGHLPVQEGLSYAGFLSDVTGYKASSGFGLVTHFYNLKNRLVPEKAYRICTIMDYVVMKLSGRKLPLIDPTNAASLGFFDSARLGFDHDALRKADIDAEILPEIKPSGTLAGFFQGNIPIYSAIGDNQASFMGSVGQMENSVLINIGTGSQISVYAPEFVKSEFIDTRPFPGGGYLLVGAALYGGKSLVLLKSFFEQTIELFAPECSREIDFFGVLNSLNRSVLHVEECLRVDPVFKGSRRDPARKGTISQVSPVNFTPEFLMAGFLKGISMELVDFFREMPGATNREFKYLIGSGNAIRMNPILRDVVETAFNMKLLIPAHAEEAAFGACLCAMVGRQHVANFRDAGSLVDYEIP